MSQNKIIEKFEEYMINNISEEIASIFFSTKSGEINEVIIYQYIKLDKSDANKIIVNSTKITSNNIKEEENLEINNFTGTFFDKDSFNLDLLKDVIIYIKDNYKANSVFATIYFDQQFYINITYMAANSISKIQLDENFNEKENQTIDTKDIFRFQ